MYERLPKDLSNIDKNLKKKQEKLKESIKEDTKITKIIENKNNQLADNIRTLDTHWVKSEMERSIDDILYNQKIAHAYNVKINKITERTVQCDWFIPVIDHSKGIYIELWGDKGNSTYDKNKEEKLQLYKKHNLKLIEIDGNMLKHDSQQIFSMLINQIEVLKAEIYEEQKNR